MNLRRFWLEFETTVADELPPGIRLGCGVTAYDRDDAMALVRERVFDKGPLPVIRKLVEDVDISTLDADHVLPNMKTPIDRGVWFPLGY